MNQLDEYAEQVRKLAGEGMSDARIAETLPIEVSGQIVYRYRLRHGIEKRRAKYASVLDPYADDIRRMYVDEGMADQLIADALPVKIDGDTVRAFRIRKLGIASTRNKKVGRFSMEARYEQIKDQLPEAWERSKRWHKKQNKMVGSSARVAEELGVSMSTAQKWLARHGLVEKRIDGKEASKDAKALFDQGWSVPRIASHLGASEYSVRDWLNGQGCDLSGHMSRMSHSEKIAWRRSISEGKAASVAGSGRYDYEGVRLDSWQEVIFAKNCDRLGLEWRVYDRAQDGVLEVIVDGEIVRYAPDFMVGTLPVEVKGIYDSLAATKVKAWRNQSGRPKLAMIMKQELFELEAAGSIPEAMLTLEAACYLDPPAEKAYWNEY